VENCGTGELPRDELASLARAQEYVLMSLRLAEGLDLARLNAISGLSLPRAALADLSALNLIATGSGRVVATPKGRMVLNSLIRKLTEDLAP
jgi:oxygen-independent coproporphyrinogen-3 oxidase